MGIIMTEELEKRVKELEIKLIAYEYALVVIEQVLKSHDQALVELFTEHVPEGEVLH